MKTKLSYPISSQGLTYPPRPSPWSLESLYATASSSTVATRRNASPSSDSDGVLIIDSPSPLQSLTVTTPSVLADEEPIRGRSRSPTPRYEAVAYVRYPLVGSSDKDENEGGDHKFTLEGPPSPLLAHSPKVDQPAVSVACEVPCNAVPTLLMHPEHTAQSRCSSDSSSSQLSRSNSLNDCPYSPVSDVPDSTVHTRVPSPRPPSRFLRSDLLEQSRLSTVTSRSQSPLLSPADAQHEIYPGQAPDPPAPGCPSRSLLQNATLSQSRNRSRSRSYSPLYHLRQACRSYSPQSSAQSPQLPSNFNCEYRMPSGIVSTIITSDSIHCRSPISSNSSSRCQPEHPQKTFEQERGWPRYPGIFASPNIPPVIPGVNVVSPPPMIPPPGCGIPPLQQPSGTPSITVPLSLGPMTPVQNSAVPPPVTIPTSGLGFPPPPPWVSFYSSHQQTPKVPRWGAPDSPVISPVPPPQTGPVGTSPINPQASAPIQCFGPSHNFGIPRILHPLPTGARNERFYFDDGDVVFQIKEMRFRIHGHFIKQHSPILAVNLGYHTGTRCEFNPVWLMDVEPHEFELLLSIFYPMDLTGPDAHTLDEWSTILRLADKYEMQKVRQLAIAKLEDIAPAADKIELAKTYHMKDWLVPAYMELCTRAEALTLEEGKKIGVEGVMMIGELKQQILDGVKKYVESSM